MMKKLKTVFSLLLAFTLVLSLASQVDASVGGKGTTKVQLTYEGKIYQYDYPVLVKNGDKAVDLKDTPGVIIDNCVMMPCNRFLVKSGLGVKRTYNEEKKRMTLKLGSNKLVLTVGEKTAKLNGREVKLTVAPRVVLYKDTKVERVLIPAKEVCDYLGINYSYDDKNSIVTVSNKETVKNNSTSPEKIEKKNEKAKIVVLDAGHGGADTGAIGNGLKEKDLTLQIVKAAKTYFDKDPNFKVYYTRLTDKTLTLRSRSDFANQLNADVFVSIHINSFTSTSEGTETLYNPNRPNKKDDLTSYQLASIMQAKIRAATGFPNRGLVQRTGLSVLNRTTMPACLDEFGFITNPSEAKSMSQNTQKYGKAVYEAIVQATK
ncbi:MAG: N-acetylmuramoyl-L-alanine amidase [Lachnospiraceae bacterium]